MFFLVREHEFTFIISGNVPVTSLLHFQFGVWDKWPTGVPLSPALDDTTEGEMRVKLSVVRNTTSYFLHSDTQSSGLSNSKLLPKRCNVSWFIYFYWFSTCFRQFLRPSSGEHNCTYSFRYCQPVLLLAAIVDGIEQFHLHVSSQQQYGLTVPEAVCTVMCSWWWVE